MKDYAFESWNKFVGSRYVSPNELEEIMGAKISEISSLVGEQRMVGMIATKPFCGPKTWRTNVKMRIVDDLIFFAGRFFEIDKLPEEWKEITATFIVTRLAHLETARVLCNMMSTVDSLDEMATAIQRKHVKRLQISDEGFCEDCDYSKEFDITCFRKYYGKEWHVKATELSWKNSWHKYYFTKMKEGKLPFEEYDPERHKDIINQSMKDTLTEIAEALPN